MIIAVDVRYEKNSAKIGGVLFEHWDDPTPAKELVSLIDRIDDYEPGKFYKRELPCILKLIQEYDLKLQCIVIDGYVYLDGISRPGLGKRLYDALNGEVAVIGVAKRPFRDISKEYKVLRGDSNKPLFVTVAGCNSEEAKENIRKMHGRHRLPTLLKWVDQLCRDIQC